MSPFSHLSSPFSLGEVFIAQRARGFQEIDPPIAQRVLAQVGDTPKLRLKPSSPSC